MKGTRSLITEINNLLDRNFGLTVEDVSFRDKFDHDPNFEANNPGFDSMSRAQDFTDDDYLVQNQPQTGNNNNIMGTINQIRLMAINGLAQLSNTPESPHYDLLKKIWQLVDKTVEVKETDKEKK